MGTGAARAVSIGGQAGPLKNTLDILAERGVFPAKEQPNRPKNAFLFRCPFHDDHEPSFSLHADRQRWRCWAGCGSGGPGELLRLFGDGYVAPPKPAQRPKKPKSKRGTLQGCTLSQLAKAKNLPPEYLRFLGWYDTIYAGKPAVAVPWPGGTHYRVNLEGNPKYLWDEGNKVSVLGLDRLEEIRRTGWVLIVEGETDFAAGRLMGLPVVAIPGASTWKDEWALLFQGCQIYVWREPGKGGETFVDKLAKSFWEIKVIEPPEGTKDLCDLHDQAGEEARNFFDALKTVAQEVHIDRTDDMGRWAGYDASSASFYNQPPKAPKQLDRTRVERHHKGNVPQIVTEKRPLLSGGHPERESLLWKRAKELFPLGGKPWRTGALMGSKAADKQCWVDFIGRTWRWPPNAQHNRALIFFNLLPRINSRQLYEMRVPIDDWSPKADEAITKGLYRAIKKAGDPKLGWCRFDNAVKRGYFIYLTNVPGLRGFEPVEDVESLLVDVLKAIDPPASSEGDNSRFNPYGGSENWRKKLQSTREEDRDKWEVLATSRKPVDFGSVEAECVVSETVYEYVKPYWRSQAGQGLETRMPTVESVKLALHLGCSLTKHGRAVLGKQAAGDSWIAVAPPGEYHHPPDADNEVVEVVI
jgi:hypothetical protein